MTTVVTTVVVVLPLTVFFVVVTVLVSLELVVVVEAIAIPDIAVACKTKIVPNTMSNLILFDIICTSMFH